MSKHRRKPESEIAEQLEGQSLGAEPATFGGRTLHRWMVQLQRSDGELSEREFACYWQPDRDDSMEAVAHACAAQTTVFEGGVKDGQRIHTFAGLTAVLQT